MTDCIKKGEVVDQVWAERRAGLCARSLRGVWGALGGRRADCYSGRGLFTPWPQAPGLRDSRTCRGTYKKPEAAENVKTRRQSLSHTHTHTVCAACTAY